jgi:hypothetical protein
MADDHSAAEGIWLPVIGKALAYFCLNNALEKHPEKYNTLLKRVRFLKGLGLSQADAAGAAGSSAKSITELTRQANKKKGRNDGCAKKKARR